ncbi:hypothetical protein L7F22_048627 [Adiantum nelumboides]|nr:hypothetical protein [Adiantum nelumboides]
MATLVSESTLLSFVRGPRFEAAVEAQFAEFDVDGDNFLSRAELSCALESLRLFDDLTGYEERLAAWPTSSAQHERQQLLDVIFGMFDRDGDGVVRPGEFAARMREMVSAIATSLRGYPLQFLLDPGSILACAVQQEAEEDKAGSQQQHVDPTVCPTSLPV